MYAKDIHTHIYINSVNIIYIPIFTVINIIASNCRLDIRIFEHSIIKNENLAVIFHCISNLYGGLLIHFFFQNKVVQ